MPTDPLTGIEPWGTVDNVQSKDFEKYVKGRHRIECRKKKGAEYL